MTADRDLGIQLTELKREAASESKVMVFDFPTQKRQFEGARRP